MVVSARPLSGGATSAPPDIPLSDRDRAGAFEDLSATNSSTGTLSSISERAGAF
jgi:hypothetical protein